jgi:aryl-alcohol dehydrogenase-like predicted oxidoreductase
VKKLAIGTAQFGLDYGVSNTTGKVNFATSSEILELAFKKNITTLDTASVYGNSEEVLGKYGVEAFDIITKLPCAPKNIDKLEDWAKVNFHLSLKKLNIKKIYCLLLHSSSDLLGKNGSEIYSSLKSFKNNGLVEKIGVSIYNPHELEELENIGIKLDLVQTPFNILDRRIESSGWLNKLNQNGIEVHSRSVFLQGLLLQNKNQRNIYFNKWSANFERLYEWINDTKQTPLSASLNFSYSNAKIDKVIIGVQNKLQLNEIINSIDNNNISIPDSLSIEDTMLINPSNWKL